ncbi:MAG: response regulator [Pirellulales bacterium]
MSASSEVKRILLVEDDPDHAKLVRYSLKDYPIPVAIDDVDDGDVAMDYLLGGGRYSGPDRPPRPDLILLDLRLPKVDGLDVLKQIKDCPDLRGIPVVILSTSESRKDLIDACDRHANSYILKPVDFTAFKLLMRDVVTYWLARNGLPSRRAVGIERGA